jgi:hypothetical protein
MERKAGLVPLVSNPAPERNKYNSCTLLYRAAIVNSDLAVPVTFPAPTRLQQFLYNASLLTISRNRKNKHGSRQSLQYGKLPVLRQGKAVIEQVEHTL